MEWINIRQNISTYQATKTFCIACKQAPATFEVTYFPALLRALDVISSVMLIRYLRNSLLNFDWLPWAFTEFWLATLSIYWILIGYLEHHLVKMAAQENFLEHGRILALLRTPALRKHKQLPYHVSETWEPWLVYVILAYLCKIPGTHRSITDHILKIRLS